MSFHPRLGSMRVLCFSLLLILTVVLLSAVTLAQDVETPKDEVFIGYQWLHPGGAADGGRDHGLDVGHGQPGILGHCHRLPAAVRRLATRRKAAP